MSEKRWAAEKRIALRTSATEILLQEARWQLDEHGSLDYRLAHELIIRASNQQQRIRKLEAHFDQAQRSLNFFLCLVNESNGIAGWHLNGDIAPWGDWQDEIDAAFVAAGEPPR